MERVEQRLVCRHEAMADSGGSGGGGCGGCGSRGSTFKAAISRLGIQRIETFDATKHSTKGKEVEEKEGGCHLVDVVVVVV